MSAKLKELFDTIGLPQAVGEGEVLQIVMDEKKNSLMINLSLDELVPMAELLGVSTEARKMLGEVEVTIYPKYHSSLFTPDYIKEIIELLKTQVAAVNGYLDDVTISDDGECYELSLKSGGKEALLEANIDKRIARYVKGFFGLDINIEFSGVAQIDVGAYISQEEQAPVPQVVIGMPTAKEEKKYTGGGGGGSRRGNGAFLKEPEDITLNFDHTHFDSEAKLFCGKNIFEEPSRMSEQYNEADAVTLWGEVFKVDDRVSKDGNTLIFTAYFSDKTSSQVLKIRLKIPM